jgi:Holliday junction resolvase RusA-like endonuclease
MGTQKPIEGPVALVCEFRLPIPKSYSKNRKQSCLAGLERPCKKPDLSNLVKALEDGCDGVVWVDDCQVVDTACSKWYADIPGVSVEVRPL